MFVYQPTSNMLELEKNKDTGYIIGWKLQDFLESKLLPLHDAFSPNIRTWIQKIGTQLNNTSLVVERLCD